MSGRRFTEEEFAMILRAATEIQAQRGAAGTSLAPGSGSSLQEIPTHVLPTMAGFIGSMAVGASLSPSSAWVGAAIVASGVGGGLAVGWTLWRAANRKSRERAERILAAARSALRIQPEGEDS